MQLVCIYTLMMSYLSAYKDTEAQLPINLPILSITVFPH